MIILSREDFRDLSIGNISKHPYSPAGEYHVLPDPAYAGRWEEANVSSRWRSGTGCWKVVPEGGRRVMEQTLLEDTETPLMVTGSRFWDDYVASVEIRPLSWARPFGLVVRYVHSRRYYLLALSQDHVAFVKRDHDEEIVLAKARWRGSVDRYYRVSVGCKGDGFRATIDGQRLFTANDGAFARGRIGLLAEAPARFAAVTVCTDQGSAGRIAAAEAVWLEEERALRAARPEATLWKRIPTYGFGTDRNLRYGDLDGDGELEIVVPQALHHGRRDSFPMIICLTAVDLDGNVLWQVGEPTGTSPLMTGDLCIQAYDWTGNGVAEVICTQDFQLKVMDGKTGQVLKQVPTPVDTNLLPGEPYVRTFGDSIYFCDLEGCGERRNLILKDRYKTVWAFDNDLNAIWSRHLKTGHYPIAYDVDGDGCEELLVGYTLLDHDGRILWQLDLEDHLDGAYMGRLHGPDSPIRIVMGCSDEGFVIADVDGNILKHQRRGHCQGVSIGRFFPNRDDLQIATITFWHHPGIITVYDLDGNVLSEFEPLQIGSILPPVDWAGDRTALLLHNTDPKRGGMMDPYGHRVVMFPDDGHPVMCCEAVDIDRDGHQEILTWDFDSIWIYRAAPGILPPAQKYHVTPVYNNSNYRARWLIPCVTQASEEFAKNTSECPFPQRIRSELSGRTPTVTQKRR